MLLCAAAAMLAILNVTYLIQAGSSPLIIPFVSGIYGESFNYCFYDISNHDSLRAHAAHFLHDSGEPSSIIIS